MAENFDFEAALKAIQSGQSITGKDGVLGPLVKQLTEAALEAELDSHLAEDIAENRKNGKSRKTVKSTSGKFELETPRDRAGTGRTWLQYLTIHRKSAKSFTRPTRSSR
jgi:transposase-like protein